MLSETQFILFSHLNQIYKLGLTFRGKQVLRGETVIMPWQLVDLFTPLYERAKNEALEQLTLKFCEEKLSDKPAPGDISPKE